MKLIATAALLLAMLTGCKDVGYCQHTFSYVENGKRVHDFFDTKRQAEVRRQFLAKQGVRVTPVTPVPCKRETT